jgi:hypothetical protein
MPIEPIKENIDVIIRRIRNKHYSETKDMTREEYQQWLHEGIEQYKRRTSVIEKVDVTSYLYPSSKPKKEKPMKRFNPVLVPLTLEENEKLQQEAEKEKTTVSNLIRQRALNNLTLQSIDSRLKKLESALSK